ncbi:MAG: hypothetical protein WD135_04780 [Ferruginibacter sp.]
MKNFIALIIMSIVISSCAKDKFTTAPQIKFVSLIPNFAQSSITSLDPNAPKLTIEVTDAEGDLGGQSITDSSMIYLKNLKSNNIDSFRFPDLTRAQQNNFKAEVTISLFNALDCISPGAPRPRTDTLFYEVYVRDAKKNKSNVITTTDALLYRCL